MSELLLCFAPAMLRDAVTSLLLRWRGGINWYSFHRGHKGTIYFVLPFSIERNPCLFYLKEYLLD